MIAVMGPEAAVNAVFFNKIQEKPEAERAAYVQQLRDEYKADIDIEKLASELVVDAVVPGDELRARAAASAGSRRLRAGGYQPRSSARSSGVLPVVDCERADHGLRAPREPPRPAGLVRDFCEREVKPHARAVGRGREVPHRDGAGRSASSASWACSSPRSTAAPAWTRWRSPSRSRRSPATTARSRSPWPATTGSAPATSASSATTLRSSATCPKLATGEWLGAWGLTEPGSRLGRRRHADHRGPQGRPAGSSTAPRCSSPRARWATSSWSWRSPTPEKRQKGITAFILEKGTPGLHASARIHGKLGMRSSDTAELHPRGRRGAGLPADRRGRHGLHQHAADPRPGPHHHRRAGGRARRAARSRSRARYAQERTAFGKPIARVPGHRA